MARNERTAAQFDTIATDLRDASNAMSSMAQSMRESGIPHVLVHGNTTLDRYLPAVLEWIDKATGETKAQIRAYLTGAKSNAEYQKEQNQKQKLAAAKKAPKKKA